MLFIIEEEGTVTGALGAVAVGGCSASQSTAAGGLSAGRGLSGSAGRTDS